MTTKVGCCGFSISRKRYFGVFNVVELQQTFYQPPQLTTVRKWYDESPDGFEYTLKAWQLITHEPKSPTYRRLKITIPESKRKNYGSFKPTDEVLQAWERTLEIARILKARIIVFQSPPGFEPTETNKRNIKLFFSNIKREKFIFSWEPRGRWSEKEIESICKEIDLVHIVDPLRSRFSYGCIRYYRLHGIGGYRYKYTKDDLTRLAGFAEEEIDTYFMFNNLYMFEDAMEFNKKLLVPR